MGGGLQAKSRITISGPGHGRKTFSKLGSKPKEIYYAFWSNMQWHKFFFLIVNPTTKKFQ